MSRWLGSTRVLAALTLAVSVAVLVFAGGRMFSPGALNGENKTGVKTGGVFSHADLSGNCSACHAPPWGGVSMASLCLGCHVDVHAQIDSGSALHGNFRNANDCRACHTEHVGPRGPLTNLAHFDHALASFPLTGKHLAAECSACHVGNRFKGTSQACVACHVEPAVHLGKFGVACAACHSTTDWKGAVAALNPATFDHDKTNFKLTGKHRTTDCKACHTSNVFVGMSQACVSCHAEPIAHRGKFGLACVNCHSTTTWKGAVVNLSETKFDHDKTAFKLTGKHRSIDCKACHATGVFTGTAQACVACHAEPPSPKVHKYAYGKNCSLCHTTQSFQTASFNHTFPINHHAKGGKQLKVNTAGNICANCHDDMTKLSEYTCYNCHAHDPAKMVRRHAGRKIANLNDCAKCHRTGRSRGNLDVPNRDVWLAKLFVPTYDEAEHLWQDADMPPSIACPACDDRR